MALPTIFTDRGDDFSLSVNYTDIATGTGYVTFYGGRYYVAGTDTLKYVLTTDPQAVTYTSAATGGGATAIDIDFDTVFLRPLIIGGKFTFAIPFAVYKSSLQPNFTVTPTVKLYKVVGAAETQIGSTIARTFDVTYDDWDLEMFSGSFDISTTTLGVGDILRLEVTCAATDHVNKRVHIYHDPSNKTITTYPTSRLSWTPPTHNPNTSRLEINIPFKIDI